MFLDLIHFLLAAADHRSAGQESGLAVFLEVSRLVTIKTLELAGGAVPVAVGLVVLPEQHGLSESGPYGVDLVPVAVALSLVS